MKPQKLASVSLVVLAVLATTRTAVCQEPALHDLDALVARAMATWEVPGVAIAIVKDDRVVLAKGYGVRELGSSSPVDEETVFAVASNTKAFTVALLGMLVDEGKLDWDDPVIDHLPSFAMFDPWVTRDIRIRDLLTHRSGLSTCGGDQLWLGNPGRAEIIRRIRFLEPDAPFRTRFQYQNLMFLVAGEIVPAVSASSWDAMLRQRIFEPLCMQRSNSSVKDLKGLENVATPHEVVGGRLVPIAFDDTDGVAPAGAINSCAIDMAQWMRLQLSGGMRDGKTILSPRVMREMHSMQMPVGISEEREERFGTRFAGYGLGWELSDYRGVKIIAHGGGLSGMFSRQTLVPEMGLGVVVMTNHAPNRLCGALTYTILDAYAGGPTKDWIAEHQTMDTEKEARDEKKERELHEQRVNGTSPSHPLESYTGPYRDRFSGDANLDLRDGQLFFTYNSRCLGPLTHWHHDTFRVDWQHPIFDMDPKTFLTFTINEAGHIEGLTVTFYHPTHFEKVREALVPVQSP